MAGALFLLSPPASTKPSLHRLRPTHPTSSPRLPLLSRPRLACAAAASNHDASSSASASAAGDGGGGSSFCIIEGPETVRDFVQMQLQEIEENIRSRRNRIFLLMEEVRRLRIQQRIKCRELVLKGGDEENEMPDMPSTIPFLPPVTKKTLKQLYLTSFSMIAGIIVFGGLLAPTLELKLGLGGTSYEDFIHMMHLPLQLRLIQLWHPFRVERLG